jgi:hypothetical protein
MTNQEMEAIKQSMILGYAQAGARQPSESEIEACFRFFSEVDFIRETRDPQAATLREKLVMGVFYRVIDKDFLIVNFDLEKGEPSLCLNNIKMQ